MSLILIAHHEGYLIPVNALQLFAVNGFISVMTGLAQRKIAIAAALEALRPDLPADEFAERWMKHRAAEGVDTENGDFDTINMSATFVATCALLACKNVSRVEHQQPAKLQAARRSRGKLPLVSYHTLVVGGNAPGKSGLSKKGTGEPLAIHWVRGHFKHYTAEKPLLGRAVGTYWWSPHLAGRADRIVEKDYLVKV